MRKRVRVIVGIAILMISIALLVWGVMPARRETRIQPISPAELQLPTPTSLDLEPSPVV